MTVPHEQWEAFVESHEELRDEATPRESAAEPRSAAEIARALDQARESAFLARIDPWIVPVILTILAVVALMAMASHH